MSEEQLEQLGRLIDTLDNYLVYAEDKPFTPAQRLQAMAHGLKEVRETVLRIYTEVGGEDVWS